MSYATPPARASAAGELRIATEGAYPPFNYVENGEPAGFEVEIGHALCAAMGRPCTFVLQDWEALIPGLKADRYDAIMSSMEITPERSRKVAFSAPYYRIPSAVIAPKGAVDPKSFTPESLKGHSVGVVADSEFEKYLKDILKLGDVRTYGKLEEADLDLLTGRIDFVLGDKLELSRFLDTREGGCCTFVADLPVDRGPGVGVAVRKADTSLLEQFNKAIATIKADGTYDRVRAKYFSFRIK